MSHQRGSPTAIYHICVRNVLDEGWVRVLDTDIIATHRHYSGPPRTILTLQVSDQSALLGLLNRLHDMGLTLLSVELNSPRLAQDKEPPGGTDADGYLSG